MGRKLMQLTILATILLIYVELNESLVCLKCDSSNENCINNVGALLNETCSTDVNACRVSVDSSGNVTRGCGKCDGDNCKSCNDKDNCNTNLICKTCNSAQKADCAQTDANSNEFNSVCEPNSASCVKLINNDKHVERHCATKDLSCASPNCHTCETANCNVGIFPEGRLQCYQCSNSSECKTVGGANGLSAKPCSLYNPDEKCYTYGTSVDNMTRGCLSDTNKSINICAGNNTLCVDCNTTACNNLSYEKEQVLECIKCDSSNETKCKNNAKDLTASKCEKKITYNAVEECYSQRKDIILYRGCVVDRDISKLGECNTANSCSTCNATNGCNTDTPPFTCKICRSDEEPKCWNDADKLTGKPCRNPSNDEEVCFHGIWNNLAIRGCLVDTDATTRVTCSGNYLDVCKPCNTTNCNTLRSGAMQTSITTGLIAAILMFIVLL